MVDGILYCANTGDSRTLLCNQGKPLPMSVDHKPEDELESDRIMNAGGISLNVYSFLKDLLKKAELMET